MLKGFLLSKISNQIKHQEAHQLWQDRTRELKKINHEEDSNFIRNWLRAKYASSIRGKSVGEEKGDFENIGDSYHRWLHENRESIGLNTGDNYQSYKNTHVNSQKDMKPYITTQARKFLFRIWSFYLVYV